MIIRNQKAFFKRKLFLFPFKEALGKQYVSILYHHLSVRSGLTNYSSLLVSIDTLPPKVVAIPILKPIPLY